MIILNFHGVGRPERSLDPGEERFWISEDAFTEIVAFILRAAMPIGLTFDDGNASDFRICAPLIARHGLQAEFFPLAGRLGQAGCLSASDLQRLCKLGMTIGSQGFGHVDWRQLDAAGRKQELVTARSILAEACGHPIAAAAVPFGAYNRAVLHALKESGYRRVYSSDGGQAGTGWLRPRYSVRADMDLAHISGILNGHETVLRRLRRTASMARRRLF